jgi:RNA polymerase sigma-70 factor (ECF subfamily)
MTWPPAVEELPDERIVALVLRGDRDAYATLVRRHQDALYRHALGMVRSPDSAADLTQDSLIRAFTRLGDCHDPSRFGAWVFRILRNRCLDYLKDRRRETVPLEEDTAFAREMDDPEVTLEQAETRAAVLRALEMLPEAQREAFLLKHVEDRSYEEMAEMLNASVSALKMRVMRAREALQAHLAPQRREEV